MVDVFITVTTLTAGSAFPILAAAPADTDRQRLGFAFRQLFDVRSDLRHRVPRSSWSPARSPSSTFLGGAEFERTVPVLRIQGLAVAATFLVTLSSYMLWVVRARRQAVIANLAGLGAAVILTAALIPAWEAEGAALAMLIAESLLAAWLGVALLGQARGLAAELRTFAKAIVAVAVAAGIAVMPISPLLGVILGTSAYVVVLLLLRAIPVDLWRAIFGGWRAR